MDEEALAQRTAKAKDEGIIKQLKAEAPECAEALPGLYARCSAEARTALIKELGDPTPHRLA